ncbi:hypothetical protein GPALN_004563 [Globodera pallida]|nr:hypothetical protein GPALN_004563 [Globodera pallida]
MRVGAASHSTRVSTNENRQARPTINNPNDVAASLQHLQINEAERPSQNSHIMPQGLASSSSALASDGSNNVVTSECPICLESMLASENVKELLPCKHRFHCDCVNLWLKGNTTCPICRIEQGNHIQAGRVDRVDNVDMDDSVDNVDMDERNFEIFFQHLLIYEPERPSQNSHIQPEESHGIGQVAQTTATINRDHPMPGIGNIEMPQGQASSSSALSSDDSNNVVTSDCSICLESLLASEDVKELLACRVAHNDRPYEFVSATSCKRLEKKSDLMRETKELLSMVEEQQRQRRQSLRYMFRMADWIAINVGGIEPTTTAKR